MKARRVLAPSLFLSIYTQLLSTSSPLVLKHSLHNHTGTHPSTPTPQHTHIHAPLPSYLFSFLVYSGQDSITRLKNLKTGTCVGEKEEPYRVCFLSLFISHHHFPSRLLCSYLSRLLLGFLSSLALARDVKSSHGSWRCAAHSFTCPRSLFFSFVSSLESCCSLVEQAAGLLVNWTGRSVLLTHSLPLSERIVMGASFLTAFAALSRPWLWHRTSLFPLVTYCLLVFQNYSSFTLNLNSTLPSEGSNSNHRGH